MDRPKTQESTRVVTVAKVWQVTRFTAQNARNGSTKRCSKVTGRLQDVVDFKCVNCTQGKKAAAAVTVELKLIAEEGDTLECVDKFCYLGDMIGAGGGAEEASRMRVKCAYFSWCCRN